jgi:acyl-CoA thioesterase FadM
MTVDRHHVHTSRFELRFADRDALGHVDNAAYFI